MCPTSTRHPGHGGAVSLSDLVMHRRRGLDTREVITSLERVGQDLPQLCEQLARILVVQREENQLTAGTGQDPDFWVVEAVEALAAAGQAADMMTAALAQAGKTAGELRPAR